MTRDTLCALFLAGIGFALLGGSCTLVVMSAADRHAEYMETRR